MSRIGKQPINIPEHIEVKIESDQIRVKGPKGELTQITPDSIKVDFNDQKELIVSPQDNSKKAISMWGLFRTLIFNMVEGVINGFEKKLEIEGVGYRANLEGSKLVLSLGFSHPIEIKAPEGIEFKVEKNVITVSGLDKQLVGQISAKIRSQRKPEPYKGKGIRYQGEIIRRKAGKKATEAE